MQMTFTATSYSDLRAQMLAFLGLDETGAAPVPATPAKPTIGRPIPEWAPAGSTWLELPGAPQLRGPDGLPIQIDWIGGAPHQRVAP